MKKILIENTKGIRKLEFTLPELSGVYLIVGANGTGKTTLLTCLDRLCNPLAFAKGFEASRLAHEIDQYRDASITYITDQSSVRFHKGTQRWVPSPKRGGSAFLRNFGFPSGIFIRADSNRIDIKEADIRDGDFVAASQNIRSALNELFDTTRYNQLKRLRNRNGRGRRATYFYVIPEGQNRYYSEKRFSTGELALLRLVDQLENIPNGSLVLLDEAEMALHPRVQVALVKYLSRKAEQQNLSVFISTHSPTIIKAVDKKQIILLDESDHPGELVSVTPCYAARAIGCVDFEESNIFDYIFYVEDEMAQSVLRYMWSKYQRLEPNHATALISMIPVGGFYETARMAVQTHRQIFARSKVYAIVDADAFDNIETKPKFYDLYQHNSNLIFNLGITPEVFLIEQLERASHSVKRDFQVKFHVDIGQILRSPEYTACNAHQPRKLAKDRFSVVLQAVVVASGQNEALSLDALIGFLINSMPDGQIRQVLGPIVGR